MNSVLNWEDFTELGVKATINLKSDGTHSLTGTFAYEGDTIMYPLWLRKDMVTGTWEVHEDYSTMLINPRSPDLSGTLTLDDYTSPEIMTIKSFHSIGGRRVVPWDSDADGKDDVFIETEMITHLTTTTEFSR